MSQVHQPRTVLRKNRKQDSALQVREVARLAEEVAGKEETPPCRTEGAVSEGNQSGKKRRGRERNRVNDPNMDHEAVKLYRDTFRFCPNQGTRKDIAVTVTDLDLWKDVLNTWGYSKGGKWIKFNPLSARKMLSEYERRAAKQSERCTEAAQRSGERISGPQDSQAGLSERGDWRMRDLREREGVRLRAGGQTLEEIVTKALRQNNQP